MDAASSEPDVEHGMTAVDLFNAAIGIGNAIQEMCKTMVNHREEELCSILGLYALQNIVSTKLMLFLEHTCMLHPLRYTKLFAGPSIKNHASEHSVYLWFSCSSVFQISFVLWVHLFGSSNW